MRLPNPLDEFLDDLTRSDVLEFIEFMPAGERILFLQDIAAMFCKGCGAKTDGLKCYCGLNKSK